MLCTPSLRGPVSEWSSSIVVENCLPGAEVIIRAQGGADRVVAHGIAVGGRDRVALLPGERLRSGDELVAQQRLSGEISLWTSRLLALPVAAAPTDTTAMPPPGFVSHLYECGAGVWVGGAIPGAEVTVSGPSGALASGRADEGNASLLLGGFLPSPGQAVSVTQQAPPGFPAVPGPLPAPGFAIVDTVPVPLGSPLPMPQLLSKLPMGCDDVIYIGGIIDGAVVTVSRAIDKSSATAIFDYSALEFSLAPPIAGGGDTLTITQKLQNCAREQRFLPSPDLRLDAVPATTPSQPDVTPPCAGANWLVMSKMTGRALVTITINGIPYRGMVPPDATSTTFEVDTIPASASISAVQERCGLVSPPANVSAQDLGGSHAAAIHRPLLDCARIVRIEKAQRGAFVQLWASDGVERRPVGPRLFALSDSLAIRVVPYLSKGHEMWVEQLACSDGWAASTPPETVMAVEELPGPAFVPPPIEGDQFATVDALPGAHVDVFTMYDDASIEFLGSADVDPVARAVPLKRTLNTRDTLFAIQTLCRSSDRGPFTAVLPGEKTFLAPASLQPLSHENNPKPLVCDFGMLTCRHNGSWSFSAALHNLETEADVSFILGVELSYANSDGLRFGKTFDRDLSAAGDGPVSRIGLRTQGVPSSVTITANDNFGAFRDGDYWANVMAATGQWKLSPAWKDYRPTPEAPDEDPSKDKRKGSPS